MKKRLKKFLTQLGRNAKKICVRRFLEKLKNLTPLQNLRKNLNFSKFANFKNQKILNETKVLHLKRKDFSKTQILEFSLLNLILNYSKIISNKIEELSELKFISEKNHNLKNKLINLLLSNKDKAEIISKMADEEKKLVNELNEYSNIQLIAKNKDDKEILELVDELILGLNEQRNLKKIESLEKKLINNLDENSFSELVKLKSQLNRD